MISLNINLKRFFFFIIIIIIIIIIIDKQLVTDVSILLEETFVVYIKLVNLITSVISATKVHHFTARSIAQNQLFRLVMLVIVFKINLKLIILI